MRQIVEWINSNTSWLYIKIYENPVFFIDFWSFEHLWNGGILLSIIIYAKVQHKWIILFSLLFSYETVEILIRYLALNVFRPETVKDQFTDIFIGMLGGYFSNIIFNYNIRKINQKPKKLWNLTNQTTLFTALTISFIWVGNYQYRYNLEIFNSPGLNYLAFSLWTIGIYLTIKVFLIINKRLRSYLFSFLATWASYLLSLFLFEHFCFHILGVHEISKPNNQALIFDIIHGTFVLHIFYMMMPLTCITIYLLFIKFFEAVTRIKILQKEYRLKINIDSRLVDRVR